MSTSLLDPFLRPAGVLVVGASRNPDTISGRPVRFLGEWQYPGKVVVVNPSGVAEIGGYPAVPSIADAPGGLDVALVLVAAGEVPDVLRTCDRQGIHRAVVIASGFEGDDGRAAHAELQSVLKSLPDLRLLGPNCVGSLAIPGRATLSFSSVLLDHRPRAGSLALVTQSGAIGNALLLALIRRGAGLSSWFSTGDEASIGALELTAALLDEPACSVVGLFLEGITDVGHLPAVAAAIERTGKRVVAFRSRATRDARAAAFGHTGRVIGDDEIAHAVLTDAGIHLVGSVDELCDVLTVLSVLPAPPATGPLDVGVVTVSGGAGVIAADAIGRSPALAMARFTGDAAAEVETRLPRTSQLTNPLDIPTLGDPSVFTGVVDAVVRSGLSDAVVAVVSSLAHDYDLLADWDFDGGTPLVLTHLSPEERFSPDQAARLAAKGVATVPTALGALAGLTIWAGGGPSRDRRPIADRDEEVPGEQLGLSDGTAALGPAADRIVEFEIVGDAAEAAAVADRFGYPVVVKADGRVVAHRSDVGAVVVGLTGAAAVAKAFDEVRARAAGDDVVVQRMAPKGIEVMVSAVRDAEVGSAVLVRPGGVLVDLLEGSAVLAGDGSRWAEIIDRSPLGRLLAGWRGEPPADTAALAAFARALLDRFEADDSLRLVECNPVLVHPPGDGVSVVDVVVRRKEPT